MNHMTAQLWQRVSRIGLRTDEGIENFRHVILVNRLLLVMLVVMLFYIPIEITINGFQMLFPVLFMIGLFLATYAFNYFRLFKAGAYYLYFIALVYIVTLGVAVGPEAKNYITLVSVVVFGLVLFRSNRERLLILGVTIAAYFIQQYLFETIDPIIDIPVENKRTFSHVILVLSIVLAFLVGYYFIAINREYEQIIGKQKEQIEEKNREITDSINYAKRIQRAILPSERRIRESLPENFTLYKPKDIVAGDFYFLEQHAGHIFFAVADCTGHGIPGALVSIVCHEALNKAIREFNFTRPAQILEKASDIVTQTFQDSDEDIKDGMDISLCVIGPDNSWLWAGANNPVYIVSKNAEWYESTKETMSGDNGYYLHEIPPVKRHIGKTDHPDPFEDRTLKLEAGDTVYVFTDGFPDQFGGPMGKKFKYKAFKKLLLTIQDRPVEAQKHILDERFEAWKGDLEQVDDVCVIGVRV